MTKKGAQRKRGRPPKFGRAADLISVTLPRDVITWLQSIDEDLAWAIVKLHRRSIKAGISEVEVAQLVRFPGKRALILVNPELLGKVPGISLIPLADGRAFLALDHGRGVADLELVVLDHLEDPRTGAAQKEALLRLRTLLKQWRQDGIKFEPRSIIVAESKS